MPTQSRLSRRAVLRGLGTAIALPWLECMIPATARAAHAASSQPPLRMAFLYVPNGIHMEEWKPDKEGPLGSLPPTLAPLDRHKRQVNVLTGLTLNGARALGDGGGDHARSVAAFLTGAHPRKTNGNDIVNGPSIDQVAAAKIGQQTRFPSLELGSEPSAQGGNCDSGYSCVYTSNLSWRTATSPMAKEINPRAVFDRLFGNDLSEEQKASRARRDRYRKSILDLAAEDAGDLRRRLGADDQRKLDEYLFAVRQIERRIDEAEKLTHREGEEVPDFPRPAGVPKDWAEHVELMMDMMVLAFQTDSTRIISFMYTNAGSNRAYPQIGVNAGHHELSHHGKNRDKQAQIARINRFHVERLVHLVDRLAAVREGDGTLLDRLLLVYGSGISDGDRHNHDDLPILLIGGGGGTVTSGRHIRYPDETPLTNLYLALLERMGVPEERFGDSTGVLEGLA